MLLKFLKAENDVQLFEVSGGPDTNIQIQEHCKHMHFNDVIESTLNFWFTKSAKARIK